MDSFKLTILGCGSASPTLRHRPTSQVVQHHGTGYMIDCGEGTQLQMMRYGVSPHKIRHIFLSHLHGDHCLGVVPMLSSMAMHQKGGRVTIHTFPDGARILKRMIDFFCGPADFDVEFNIISPHKRMLLLDTDSLTVESFPLYHRVDDVGFIFREKPKQRHLIGDMLAFHQVPRYAYNAIKSGADYTRPDGLVVPNDRLTTPPTPSVSYAYCSDTVYNPTVAQEVEGVTLLYHEATYAQRDAYKAGPRGHSTATEAAAVAAAARAEALLLGHFSKSADEQEILEEARAIFPNTTLAYEGLTLEIGKR